MHAIAVVIIGLSGCADFASYAVFDVRQPIELTATGAWTESQRRDLNGAASCWNMAFGTELLVTDAPAGEQRVRVSFEVCEGLRATYIAGFRGHIQICATLSSESHEDRLFRTLAHELGHVLGIRTEGDDTNSIMGYNEHGVAAPVAEFFGDEDLELLHVAHDGITQRCNPRLVDTTNEYCTCE